MRHVVNRHDGCVAIPFHPKTDDMQNQSAERWAGLLAIHQDLLVNDDGKAAHFLQTSITINYFL